MTLDDVLQKVTALDCPRVEVTGGEPLLQTGTGELLRRLCQAGYETLLETNGSQDISAIDSRVVRIVDCKCPSSGECEQNLWTNVDHLSPRDEVKFVIAAREDYEFACNVVQTRALCDRCAVIFSRWRSYPQASSEPVKRWATATSTWRRPPAA